MQRPDAFAGRAATVRGAGFAIAVALGAVAVWLIVTSSTQKRLELGVLAGLWGLLLGAFSVFGSRRHEESAALAPTAGTELELRTRATEVESLGDVAARRAEEARLQEFLRQEIREAVNREVGSLRDEITQLRTELLEKVGGQLRLEHIETTRVIGSDLEALQDEIRALKAASRTRSSATVLDATVVEREIVNRAVVDAPDGSRATHVRWEKGATAPLRAEPGPTEATGPVAPAAPVRSAPTRPVAPPPVQQQVHQPVQQPVRAPVAAAPPAQRPAATPPAAAQPVQRTEGQRPVEPARAPVPPRTQPAAPVRPAAEQHRQSPPAEPARPVQQHNGGSRKPDQHKPEQQKDDAAAAQRSDPFADLPRLSPWVDDEPLPPARPRMPSGPRRPSGAPTTSTEPTYVRPPAAPPVPPSYEGRRRRTDEAEQRTGGVPAAERDTPGRRRRVEDDEQPDSLLAELLRRERQ